MIIYCCPQIRIQKNIKIIKIVSRSCRSQPKWISSLYTNLCLKNNHGDLFIVFDNSFIIILFSKMIQTFTKPELKSILDQRITTNSSSGEHIFTFNERQYVFLPHVFSPAFFPNTHWFTAAFLEHMPTSKSFLEIGTGAGNVLIQAVLSGRCVGSVMGSDINKVAIENAEINAQKFGVKAQFVVSNVLEQINPSKKFDLIYWNYPFHFNFDKEYEEMDEIEISLRDPKYAHLQKLLSTARGRMMEGGQIIISFSYKLGNLSRLRQIIDMHKWKEQVLALRGEDMSKNMPELCLLKLTPQ